eukprot:1115941-Alexandrium_andersonii.AAC.1
MQLSSVLRSSADMTGAVLSAIRVVLSPVLQEPMVRMVQDSTPLPDAGTVSRWRLLLDGAFMLYLRKRREEATVCRYMQADSSMQRGR